MKPYFISLLRMTEVEGTVDVKRLAVFEVESWSAHAAIYQLKSSKPHLLMGPQEFLSAAPVPPNDWRSSIERVEVAT